MDRRRNSPDHEIPIYLLLFALLLPCSIFADDSAPKLTPGNQFSVKFPEMPPTFYAKYARDKDATPQMTVFLPRNYDSNRKFPLLIFLNGGDGGDASTPDVARTITPERDFICVVVPIFKTYHDDYIMCDVDARFMWPYFRTMLEKLETLVPNIDPAHRILGGFSNGAHLPMHTSFEKYSTFFKTPKKCWPSHLC